MVPTFATIPSQRKKMEQELKKANDFLNNTAGGRLSIATEVDDHFVHITVSDNGVGIKPEHQDQIFETFFTTKTDSVKGVGLGLSVCYGFIKNHGGDIKVQSRLGEARRS